MNRDAAIEAGRDEIAGRQIGSGYYALNLSTAEADGIAEAVIDAALPHLAPRPERVVKAEALREAATQAHVLDRAPDPTGAAFHWLRGRAYRIERGEP